MSEKRMAQVTFHGLAAGGEAVGRDENGKTVFAPFAAPGDEAQVAIGEEKSSFARGLLGEVTTASEQRVAPRCPQFRPLTPSESCGGCAWQHVSLEAQREAKRQIVAAALSRLGGQEIEVEPCRGGAGYGYRNKADFVVGRSIESGEIGFFARESHDLVTAAVCPIQHPHNEEVLRAARDILAKFPHFAFDAHSGQGHWRRLVSRVGAVGETLITLVTAHPTWSQSQHVANEFRKRVPSLVGVLSRGPRSEAELAWGRDFLREEVNGLKFRVSGESFWQVNSEVAPWLVEAALELAEVRGGRALDLFCGAGLFALHLASAGADVVGIETHRGAIKDATYNAKNNGLKAQFFAGDAARELKRFGKGDLDLLLLDPPRAGAAACLEPIIRIAPQRIVYVSCDPATLARDAKTLSSGDYKLQRAIPFDLFPQTAHIETVALFTKI